MKTARALQLVALVALLGSSCTAEKALIITGNTLDILGNQFADTAAVMNDALRSGAISPEQYRPWAAFARKFKRAWPPAKAMWFAADDTKDERLLAQASAVITALAAELATFTATPLPAPAPKDGGS